MKCWILVIIFVIARQVSLSADINDIFKISEGKLKGETTQGSYSMTVTTPEYTRSLDIEIFSKGSDKSLVIIKSPPRDAGNKFLKIGKEFFTYLNATGTIMKLPPSMMLQSWNGSDLTNEELIRESSLTEDYNLKLIREENIGSELCLKIELTPKPTASTVWGRIYYWISKKENNPAYIQFYDEKSELIRTIKFSDVRKIDDRIIPSRWLIKNEKKKGYHTEFIYHNVMFNKPIPDDVFSLTKSKK